MNKQIGFCEYCGVKPKRSADPRTKYCSRACGQRAYEKRAGKSAPNFIGRIENHRKEAIKEIKKIVNKPIRYSLPTNELNHAYNQMVYYKNVHDNAKKGVFPIGMATGVTIGLANGGDRGKTKTGRERPKDTVGQLAAALLGGVTGHIFDEWRKEKIIRESKQSFFAWKREWERLKKLERATKQMIKESELIPFGNIAITPPAEKEHPTIVSGDYYKKEILPELKLSDKWKYLIGNPAPNFYMLIHGLPGQGKSTFAVQFGEYFQRNHGKVIYLASEQFGVTKSFQSLLKRYAATFDIHTKANLLNSQSAAKLINKYDAVIIDSINHIRWSHEQVEELRAKCKNTAFIAVMQSKKDGDFKGEQDFAHNSDIMIKVENLVAKQYKSRFAPPSEVPLISN